MGCYFANSSDYVVVGVRILSTKPMMMQAFVLGGQLQNHIIIIPRTPKK
jgi:hypothetical protein